jgi:hypothetical protein
MTNTKLRQAISYINNKKTEDLKELDGDKTSNYALWILESHKHLDVALEVLETELDKRLYQE